MRNDIDIDVLRQQCERRMAAVRRNIQTLKQELETAIARGTKAEVASLRTDISAMKLDLTFLENERKSYE